MPPFEIGERVRIDITDETDPDFQWHGEHGRIVKTSRDDADAVTGDTRDGILFTVQLEDYEQRLDLRWRDLRPPFDTPSDK